MNEFLDQMYGTSDRMAGGDDEQEKLAQAQVLDEVLAENEIDVNDLSAADLFKVASELFEEDAEIVKVAHAAAVDEANAVAAEEAGVSEDDMSKIAEADFMGRTMAHAFMDEMDTVKEAYGTGAAVKNVGSSLKNLAKSYGKDVGRRSGTAKLLMGKGAIKNLRSEGVMKRLGKAGRSAKLMAPELAAGGLAAGGLAAGGAAAMKKEGSALDALVEQRAIELLNELG